MTSKYFMMIKRRGIMTTIKIEKSIQAHPSEVFHYFTNSTALRDWMCTGATADPRPGGRIYMWWNEGYYTSGEFLQLEKDEVISFSWHGRGEPHPTNVYIRLKKKKSGTLLKLTHRKLGNSSKWLDIGKEYEKEWKKSLENLASVLENGADLRITTRPMLGITTDLFNAGVAEKLGVPVVEGLRISGVVDGLGAQKAGLIADDIIVGLDGQEITGAVSFASFIQGKKAGDKVKVSYYRCAEKKTTTMTLSGRPIPTIPNSGLELSKQVEPVYTQYEAEIESLLKDAKEDECNQKPASTDWSANEVLAHLIHSELGWQNAMSDIIGGHEAAYDDWGGNIQAHIEGTVVTFTTKVELFKELKNHNAETLHMLAHIPAEFVSHKGRFWKLAFQATQNSYHLQSHLEQMRAAIQFARK
jgi:uncharacterized protein YndB with AHSA1/START domain